MAAATPSKQAVMKSAQKTVKRFNTAWDYAKTNHHPRWERNWKLYNNKRVNPSYKGITNTFVPITYSTVETIMSALCSGRPSTDFVPQDMYKYIQKYAEVGTKPDLKALNAQFDYYWDCDNLDLKTIKTVRSGLIYGTACEWVYWDDDKPRVINMNVRDAIIDPSLTDPMQLWTNPNDYYTGRRYITTKSALESVTIVDPDTGELKKRFKNLDKVTPTHGTTGEDTDKQKKDMQIGSLTDDAESIEVIEIWDGKKIQSVANRAVIIEDRDNTLGIHCLVIHRFIADESIIYGKSIIDPIAAPQELLNDVTNQRTDAVTDSLFPERRVDPQYASMIPKMKSSFGATYPMAAGGMEYMLKPRIDGAAYNEGTLIKNDMREATASDQVVKGVTTDQNATATEIKTQVNQAGERFEIYVRMLEREGLWQRTKIMYRLMLNYKQGMDLVPTRSLDGLPQFLKFIPEQYDASYEPQIKLESRVKAEQKTVSNEAMQQFQIVIQDPQNNLYEAKKIFYKKMFNLNDEEIKKIIGAEDPALAQQADPLAGDQLLPESGIPEEDVALAAQQGGQL